MLVSLLLAAAPAEAQDFLAPLTAPMGPSATAVLADGSTVEGKPKVIPKGMGNIKKVTLKLEGGGKKKLTAADVTETSVSFGRTGTATCAPCVPDSVPSVCGTTSCARRPQSRCAARTSEPSTS